MSKTHLDRIYTAPEDGRTEIYDAWAESYDQELTQNGYQTPARLATLLATVATDLTAPVFDFGCGTGLSGQALHAAGFTTVDGCDLSAGMLSVAKDKSVYRKLFQSQADEGLPTDLHSYPLVTAVGAISTGAAPAPVFDMVVEALAPGSLFAFSFNQHALEDPDYSDRLDRRLQNGDVRLLAKESGPHIVTLGTVSTVFVLEKRR